MAILPASLQQEDPKKVAKVALTVFFNITKSWKITTKQEIILLGSPPRSTFYKWRSGTITTISQDTLERISYIMGIYKALRKIFPTLDQANAWPIKPNQAFNNMSGLEYMLLGGVQHLSDVRRYLDDVVK